MRYVWLLCSIGIAFLAVFLVWPRSQDASCRFIALDVGQGDAILIQTPDKNDVLIDGGPDNRVVELLPKYLGAGNRDLELVVLTHPDNDHIHGLVQVLDRFFVRAVMVSAVENPTAIYSAWTQSLAEHQIVPTVVSWNQNYELGNFLQLQVLWPPPGDGWKVSGGGTPTNDASVSLKATCAGSTAVLTGDASSAIEDRILTAGFDLRATLFKVGHHGSRTSNLHAFLRAIDPELAVISVGAENRYGHPHPTVLRRYEHLDIEVARTDQSGTLVFQSDGSGGWEQLLTK